MGGSPDQIAGVRVLGDVCAVATDGSVIDLPSPSQRRLLGLLALHAPRRLRSEMLLARATEMVPTAARTLPLAELTVAGLHPESLNDWETNLRKLTGDHLQQVVRKYLTPANRSVLVVTPGGMRGTIP